LRLLLAAQAHEGFALQLEDLVLGDLAGATAAALVDAGKIGRPVAAADDFAAKSKASVIGTGSSGGGSADPPNITVKAKTMTCNPAAVATAAARRFPRSRRLNARRGGTAAIMRASPDPGEPTA